MAKKTTRKVASLPEKSGGAANAAELHFKKGVITRGEAVENKTGSRKLPPGATHLVGEAEKKENAPLKRIRFSLG